MTKVTIQFLFPFLEYLVTNDLCDQSKDTFCRDFFAGVIFVGNIFVGDILVGDISISFSISWILSDQWPMTKVKRHFGRRHFCKRHFGWRLFCRRHFCRRHFCRRHFGRRHFSGYCLITAVTNDQSDNSISFPISWILSDKLPMTKVKTFM